MTDKESSLAFVERIRTLDSLADLTITERVDLLKLAKTAALIEEHELQVLPNMFSKDWTVRFFNEHCVIEHSEASKDLHTAVQAVADKIKEGE